MMTCLTDGLLRFGCNYFSGCQGAKVQRDADSGSIGPSFRFLAARHWLTGQTIAAACRYFRPSISDGKEIRQSLPEFEFRKPRQACSPRFVTGFILCARVARYVIVGIGSIELVDTLVQ